MPPLEPGRAVMMEQRRYTWKAQQYGTCGRPMEQGMAPVVVQSRDMDIAPLVGQSQYMNEGASTEQGRAPEMEQRRYVERAPLVWQRWDMKGGEPTKKAQQMGQCRYVDQAPLQGLSRET